MTPTECGGGLFFMGFKPCELRAQTQDGLVCGAAGGVPLAALRQGEEPLESVCGRCTVPEKLAQRPCLFMVPVRVRQGGTIHDFFGCHWYHRVSRLEAQRDTYLCGGCPDWFPRPPVPLILNYRERTRRMVAFFADVLEGRMPPLRKFPAPRPVSPPRPWWRRVWAVTVGWRMDSKSDSESSAGTE